MSPQETNTAWSHPPGDARPHAHHLTDHASAVAENMRTAVAHAPPLSNGTPIHDVIDAIAYGHDIGKLTPWFQAHIGNSNVSTSDPEHHTSTNHAKIGAAATWYALSKRDVDVHTRLVAIAAVVRHHQAYPELNDDIYTKFVHNDTLWSDTLPEQVTAIDELNADTANTLLDNASGGNASWDEFHDLIVGESLQHEIMDAVRAGDDSDWQRPVKVATAFVSEDMYMDLLRVWSALTASDARDAANITQTPTVPHPTVTQETVTNHINSLPDGETELQRSLNQQRTTARNEVLETITTTDTGDVFELTLPTGMGKTLTGISAAIAYREQSEPPRIEDQNIVYALPYTSIIEQTADTLEDVFNTDPDGDLLTVHHHLRETTTTISEEEYTSSAARLAGESWMTDVTLTTFVQLFESLTGPGKSESYKLPQLHNSIIILDEPQLLPLDWWPAITKLIDLVTEHYNATVFYMTATQPAIADAHETVELVSNPDAYAGTYPRVTYRLHESLDPAVDTGLEIPAAAKELAQEAHDGSDILSICNTITETRSLYHETVSEAGASDAVVCELNKELGELISAGHVSDGETTAEAANTLTDQLVATVRESGPDLITCQLTSRHRPCDRAVLLAAIERITNGDVPVVVVATQVVEAGVDLSFKRVYRDFAPVDSVVQAGGRCNRSYEQGVEGGEVTVWQLDIGSGRLPCEQVYATELNRVDAAFNALGEVVGESLGEIDGSMSLSETQMRDGVEAYHSRLGDRMPASHPVITGISGVNGDLLGQKSMIESGDTTQIMFPMTDGEMGVVEELIDGFGSKSSSVDGGAMGETQAFSVSVRSRKSRVVEKIKSLPVVPVVETPFEPVGGDAWYSVVDGAVIPDTTVDARLI